jgi:predicted RNase H-like HicB family nuclease
MSKRRYPVIIEQTSTGYSAYSPDVAGCAAVGESKETRRDFQDALSAHFEVMREIGTDPGTPRFSRLG